MRKTQIKEGTVDIGSDLENMAKVKKPMRTRATTTDFGRRPFTPWTAYNNSTPEHDLLLKYRHVYAGKGGKYGGPSVSPSPVHGSFSKYSEEILQKITRALRQQNVDAKVSQVQQPPTAHQAPVDIAQNKTASKRFISPSNAVDARTGRTNVGFQGARKLSKDNSNSLNQIGHGITLGDSRTYKGFTKHWVKDQQQKLAATQLHGSGTTHISESNEKESEKEQQKDQRSQDIPSNGMDESTRKNMNLFSRMSIEAQAALRDMIPEGMTSHNTSYDVIDVEDAGSISAEVEEDEDSSDEETEAKNIYGNLDSKQRVTVSSNKSHRNENNSRARSRNLLPHISPDQVTLTSDESLRGEPTIQHFVPGIGRFNVVPYAKLPREQTFKITPQGYDSRYSEPVRTLQDDTPQEIKAKAVAKCSDWINKYL